MYIMSKALYMLVSAGIAIFLVAADSSYAFRENIVAAWPLDEGSGKVVKESTGNFSDGEIIGEAEWVDGKFGKALRLDGSTYVQIPFNPKFQVLNEGGFTFAAWFNTETLYSIRGDYVAGFQQMDGNGTGRTWMGIKGGDRSYSYLGNGDTFGTSPEIGQWYHFAIVVEEGGDIDTIQIYSNGKPETAPSSRGIETCEGDLLIGCHKDKIKINFWEGLIDDIVIINKALTEEEINELMNKGVSGFLAVESRDKLTTTWGYLKSLH
jgi:hypothetical protein